MCKINMWKLYSVLKHFKQEIVVMQYSDLNFPKKWVITNLVTLLEPAVFACDTLGLNLLNVDAQLAFVRALQADDREPEAAALGLVQLDVLDLTALGSLHDSRAGILV